MITMNFQIFSEDEMMLLILQKNLHQPFKLFLQKEIINTKCRNRKKQEQERHVNKKWQEEKKMIQKGSEDPGMAKPKETQRPMEEKII